MTNEEFEPIRIRIMQEAYELADRNDTEGFNAVKVVCSDVQNLMHKEPLTDKEGRRTVDKDEALKLALHALEVWKLMQPNTTACAIRIPAIAAIEEVLIKRRTHDTRIVKDTNNLA